MRKLAAALVLGVATAWASLSFAQFTPPAAASASLADGGTIGGCVLSGGVMKCAAVDAGVLNVEGQARVAGTIVGAGRVNAGSMSLIGTGGLLLMQNTSFSSFMSCSESTAACTFTAVRASSGLTVGTIVVGGGGTGTATVTGATGCVCSEATDETKTLKCVLSGNTLTATGTSGDSISYICL